jgi:hypothetical protein
MARMVVVGLVALVWISTAVGMVVITATTNVLWNAQIAFLVVAAVIAAAWGATATLLRRTGLQLPYRPE